MFVSVTGKEDVEGRQNVPTFSFRNGYDLGNAARFNLKKLSVLERMILSPIALYGHTVQFAAARNGNQLVKGVSLHGHVISFPNKLSLSEKMFKSPVALPREDMVSNGSFKVTFIGSKTHFKSATMVLNKDFPDVFRCSASEIMPWFLFMKMMKDCNPWMYPPNLTLLDPNFVELENLCGRVSKQVVESATCNDDPLLINLSSFIDADIAKQMPGRSEAFDKFVEAKEMRELAGEKEIEETEKEEEIIDFETCGLEFVMCGEKPNVNTMGTFICKALLELVGQSKEISEINILEVVSSVTLAECNRTIAEGEIDIFHSSLPPGDFSNVDIVHDSSSSANCEAPVSSQSLLGAGPQSDGSTQTSGEFSVVNIRGGSPLPSVGNTQTSGEYSVVNIQCGSPAPSVFVESNEFAQPPALPASASVQNSFVEVCE